MISYKQYLIIFVLLISSFSQAQVIEVTPFPDNKLLHIATINQESVKLETEKLSNIKTRNIGSDDSISYDGNVLFIRSKLIKKMDGYWKEVPLPEMNFLRISIPLLSMDGKWLVYLERNTTSDIRFARIVFFNVEEEKITDTYEDQIISTIDINADATRIIYYWITNDQSELVLLNHVNNSFTTNKINTRGTYFTSLGDRMISSEYNHQDQYTHLYITDEIGGKWNDTQDIVLLNETGQKIKSSIFGLANNGRTILVSTLQGMAVIHENDGQWNDIEYIGYGSKDGLDQFELSENGQVIAVKSLYQNIEDAYFYYDVFVFIRTPDGQWKKFQVNSPSVKTTEEILLTKDGTQLWWLPMEDSSTIMKYQ